LLSTVVAVVPAATGTGSSGASSSGKGGSALPFVFLLVIFALVYLLFIRPARNRQRAATEARRQAGVGDEIITTSGLIATVVEVNDDALTLEIAPGVRARYVPAAVLRVTSAEAEPDVTNHEVIDAPPEEPGDRPDGPAAT
jgi:preprotein translocase subunit YajC